MAKSEDTFAWNSAELCRGAIEMSGRNQVDSPLAKHWCGHPLVLITYIGLGQVLSIIQVCQITLPCEPWLMVED